ncbi:GNAT family N-acetyltransferase [Streptomyces virginiae]|uniref:GNAT family N-acetyltransferase n=1 Tax=Streptomyces virginiae TaxID=1961 RepID=UPI00364D862B
MDASRYRIRPLQADDIDTAVDLMAQANPRYDKQGLAASRYLLEMVTSAGTQPTPESMRAMSHELAKLSAGALTADEVHHKLSDSLAAGENPAEGALLALVAEEVATGQVIGLVTAGPPGRWTHQAITQLPPATAKQIREHIVEIMEIAVSPSARRQGIGQELLSTLLNHGGNQAQAWRVGIGFFHENSGFGQFHRAMAPEWPAGHPITFLDSAGQAAPFRELDGDLRACVVPLHQNVRLVMDPTGTPAIDGVFDQPWPPAPGHIPRPAPRSQLSKSDRKREKKARGRARG